MAGLSESEMASSAVRSLRKGGCTWLRGSQEPLRKKGEDIKGKDISAHTPLRCGTIIVVSCATS